MAEVGVSLTDVHLKMTLIYTPSPPSTAPHLHSPPPPEETPGIYSNDVSKPLPGPKIMQDVSLEAGFTTERGGLLWTRMELDGASVNSGSPRWQWKSTAPVLRAFHSISIYTTWGLPP